MDFKKDEAPKAKAKKTLKQPSIVNFLDQETQRKFMQKHYSTPVKSVSDLSFRGARSPLSPMQNNVIYPSPVVDLNAVEKTRDFYSMEEFSDDMNTTGFKKALFNVEEKTESVSADQEFNRLKESTIKDNVVTAKKKPKKFSKPWLCIKYDEPDGSSTETDSCKSSTNLDSDECFSDPGKQDLKNIPKNTENVKDTKKKVKPKTARTHRQANEIQTVSQVCPVLFRDPPKQSLRHELDNLGITKPFSIDLYSFNRCLEDFGTEIVNQYFKDAVLNVKTKTVKSCLYCGFQTESSLVLGSHLDDRHKARLKQWPFSSRMDFNRFAKV